MILTVGQETERWLYGLGIAFIMVAIILAILAVRVREFRFDPQPRVLQEKYSARTASDVIALLTSNLVEAYEFNRSRILRKNRLFTSAILLMGLSLVFLVASVMIYQGPETKGVKGEVVVTDAGQPELAETDNKPTPEPDDEVWRPPPPDPDLAD